MENPMEASKSFTAYRFRLYPTGKQKKRMEAVLEVCRLLWNDALEQRNENWKETKRRTTYRQQAASLTESVSESPELQAVYSQSLQDCLKRLDKGFKRFFTQKSGHPRFKKQGECSSFTYPQASNGSVRVNLSGKRLRLSRIGEVRAVFHREPPCEGIKTCTIKKENDGRWYASLVYENALPLQDVKVPDSWKSPIGIDLGLKSLIATSDGKKVEPQKFYRKAESKLVKLQRRLSRKKKGSKNRAKAKQVLAVQHSHVANQRMDFNQKLSSKLVETHDLIGFEDLAVENMAQNHCLVKSIHDAGWSQLVSFVEYKVKRKEKRFIKVPAPFTTQECFFCGALNHVSLEVREFECIGCFRWLDRDTNSGRVVLKRAIAKVGQDRSDETKASSESHSKPVPELVPVEAGKRKKSRRKSAMRPVKQELHAPLQELETHGFKPWEDVTENGTKRTDG